MKPSVYYVDDLVRVSKSEVTVGSDSYNLIDATAVRVRWLIVPKAPNCVKFLLPTLLGLALISLVMFVFLTMLHLPELEYPSSALISATLTVLPIVLLAMASFLFKWVRRVIELEYGSSTVYILTSDSLATLKVKNIVYLEKIKKAITQALNSRSKPAP